MVTRGTGPRVGPPTGTAQLADIHRAFDDWEQQVIGQFHEEIEWLGEHRHRSVGGKCANTEIHRLFGIFGAAGLLKPGRGGVVFQIRLLKWNTEYMY